MVKKVMISLHRLICVIVQGSEGQDKPTQVNMCNSPRFRRSQTVRVTKSLACLNFKVIIIAIRLNINLANSLLY